MGTKQTGQRGKGVQGTQSTRVDKTRLPEGSKQEERSDKIAQETTTITSSKVVIRRQFDPTYQGSPGYKVLGKSLTVPSQALTVEQLLINHTKGINSGVTTIPDPQYLGDTEIPIITDITDIAEHREKLEQQKQIINQKIKDETAAQTAEQQFEQPNPQQSTETPSEVPKTSPETDS